MKVTHKKLVGVFAAFAIALVAVLSPLPVGASCDETTLNIENGVNCGQGEGTPATLFGAGSVFTTIVNILLFIIGAISVIMLIIGGIRYTLSNGDSGAVTSAKNTILYAIVGLVIAFLAFAIVNWVLGSVSQAS